MSKPIKVILSAIAILLISGAVFWSVKNGKQQKVKPTQNTITENQGDQKQEEQNNNAEAIDTSDWKTYRNEKFRFEFKYPEREIELISNNNFIRLHRDCSEFSEDIILKIRCDLESDISFGDTNKDLNAFIKAYKSDCDSGHCFTFISRQEDYILDGFVGKKLIGTNAEGAGALNYIFIIKDKKNYVIAYTQLDSVYSKIISTFRFI